MDYIVVGFEKVWFLVLETEDLFLEGCYFVLEGLDCVFELGCLGEQEGEGRGGGAVGVGLG